MSHQCPAPECDKTIADDSMLMCSRDWYRVPKPLRTAVWRAYANGAGLGSPALHRAQQVAIMSLSRTEP
jgi:hypothetical protein